MKGKNNPMYGKHHTEDSKNKIRLKNKGKPSPWTQSPALSKIIGKKISILQTGKSNSFYNKKHTDETRKKMSIARMKREIRPNAKNIKNRFI